MSFIKLLLVLAMLHPLSAKAEILTHLGFNYEEEKVDQGSVGEVQQTRQTLNLGIGYLFDFGLFLGLKYYQKNVINDLTVTVASTTVTTSTKDLTSGSGMTLGYYVDFGLVLQYSYLFQDPKRESADVTYSGGTASVIDLAYVYWIGNFAFGPQLTQTTFTYEEQEDAGVVTEIDITHTHLMPMIALWFKF
ncbi:hypothetical protein [Pseudobacteriovorax antillogorgiicola]|uniref:Outer membrane protein beta-barrel domain-containing protein n=1 Tax=Pseudobacteriovorax antillogorgiicola TaxID=1513793 RepID=A0A1Y6BCN9_9BACT|nr:hypothetical protein [Pseudobacteriovorax antillogorgiicola]TCS56506.1 hypothetical protein EDD56_104328 [Pseudobacteriovorax antillogorgiicola]SMF04616.1 hypothetical protein SAMN06296036_1045 [Pseudobacteriovorax antillogorgiicola]